MERHEDRRLPGMEARRLAAGAWRRGLRPVLARSRRLRAARRAVIERVERSLDRSFWELPDEQAVRMGYNVLLRREPDAVGVESFMGRLGSGALSRDEFLDHLRFSEEFRVWTHPEPTSLRHSLHHSRCEFVIGLPPARRILDLGGSSSDNQAGALVGLGYPYSFESLTVIDLPPGDRHPLYRSEAHHDVDSVRGPVRYAYHSMTDLGGYDDASFDLVYSGQSIEHVTESEADHVLPEVHRLLSPGGFFAVDTPNARACRAQQEAFIDPDHKVEYTHSQMTAKLERAGFVIVEAKGLNYLGRSLAEGKFSAAEATLNSGVYATPEDCYLLAYLCQKRP